MSSAQREVGRLVIDGQTLTLHRNERGTAWALRLGDEPIRFAGTIEHRGDASGTTRFDEAQPTELFWLEHLCRGGAIVGTSGTPIAVRYAADGAASLAIDGTLRVDLPRRVLAVRLTSTCFTSWSD